MQGKINNIWETWHITKVKVDELIGVENANKLTELIIENAKVRWETPLDLLQSALSRLMIGMPLNKIIEGLNSHLK